MKRTLSLILGILMLASILTGCSSPFGLNEYEQALIGSWYYEIDISAEYGADFTADPDFGPHSDFGGGIVKVVFNFYDDATYKIEADPESAQAAYDDLKADLTACYTSYVNELATTNELSFEETIAALEIESIDALVEEDLAALEYEDWINDFSQDGNFVGAEDRIFFSDGKEYRVDEKIYETYELDGDTLTITSYVDNGEVDTEGYPLVMTKE